MKLAFVVLLLLTSASLFGQEWKQMNGDDLFALARKIAFDGKHEEARAMLQHVLQNHPDYHEVRVFMARTYYWDSQLTNARQEIEKLLSQDPENIEALELLADVELADRKFERAIEVADRGLTINATSESFLYRKANALVQLNRNEDAAVLLAQLLSIDPSHEDALKLAEINKMAALKNSIGIQYGIDAFSSTYRPAHYLSLQATRIGTSGTGILRLNYTNRFAMNGLQGEIDLYPKISNGIYGYLNYGYSNSALFPSHRAGAELYSRFLRSFEASIGARYLYFEAASNVTMLTGSVSFYYRNYLFSFRPFITSSSSQNGFSSVLNARRYLRDGDNFVGISGGIGFSPDERRIQSTNGLSSDAVYNLKAQRASANWQTTFSKTYIALVSAGVVRQELSFSQGDYVWISSLSVMVRKRY